MTLAGIIEALGLGSARDARELVGRLDGAGRLVATLDDPVARALLRAGHRVAAAPELADAALALGLPSGGEALPRLQRLRDATRAGGRLVVATPSGTRDPDRAKVAGLLLRIGCTALHQDGDGGIVFSSGQVRRPAA